MLAGKYDSLEQWNKIKFPVMATQKLDGIRCLKVDGVALSRKFKEIPNQHIRQTITAGVPDGCDGEIIIPGRSFNDLSGDVRRFDGKPDFVYAVFDYVTDVGTPYITRMDELKRLPLPSFCIKILPTPIMNMDQLSEFEASCSLFDCN